jgi:Protein of unknown function (DUF3086)
MNSDDTLENPIPSSAPTLESLEDRKQLLENEIRVLEEKKQEQLKETTELINQMLKEGLAELESRKQRLELSIEQLEKRREKIKEEMRTTFAGTSQDLAIRVQGFKDYLVGSLQDLAAAAEKLELAPPIKPVEVPTLSRNSRDEGISNPVNSFAEHSRQIKSLLEQYRNRPDYYGPAWQLRRTFEPIHAERVQKWFFNQGGRGTIRATGSRLQNILTASAVVSILYNIYGPKVRALILVSYPERLGEWRRGLQDCLGISRSDFGPDKGVVLFEAPEALIQKAERLIDEGQMPIVILDETEEQVNVSLLQFPLWLAFALDPQQQSSGFNY